MSCVRAHRAANPEKYPVSDAVKKLYPAYEGIESKMKPTMVHLQVYDGTPPASSFFFVLNGDYLRRRSRDPDDVHRDQPCEILLSSHYDVHQACHEHASHRRIAKAQTANSVADVGPHTWRDSFLTHGDLASC